MAKTTTRKPAVLQSKLKFKFGAKDINFFKTYTCLGPYINEHLDFEKMSKSFCDPASRALSAVMCKSILKKVSHLISLKCFTTVA